MTGAICRIGNAIKKSDPNIKVSYVPGLPGTFIYKSGGSGIKCASLAYYCKKPEEVAAQICTA